MSMQKLLDWKMAEFRIQFLAVWSRDGTLEMLGNETESRGVKPEAEKEQTSL